MQTVFLLCKGGTDSDINAGVKDRAYDAMTSALTYLEHAIDGDQLPRI